MNTFNPALGYLWNSAEHGTFSPNVGRVELTREQAEEHNAMLAQLEQESMGVNGRAVLYLTKDAEGRWSVQNFTGTFKLRPTQVRKSRNNWGAERFDAWFLFNGHVWHGVNVGDNEILRARQTKQKAPSAGSAL